VKREIKANFNRIGVPKVSWAIFRGSIFGQVTAERPHNAKWAINPITMTSHLARTYTM